MCQQLRLPGVLPVVAGSADSCSSHVRCQTAPTVEATWHAIEGVATALAAGTAATAAELGSSLRHMVREGWRQQSWLASEQQCAKGCTGSGGLQHHCAVLSW